MDTRGFKLCAAAVGILPVTAGCTDRAPQEHPNILFILSDDHTSQSWGIYGGILAPYAANDNIARLAAEGCVLDNAFCTNSISVPSRAAILTGQSTRSTTHCAPNRTTSPSGCSRPATGRRWSANDI